ncbi:IclR family transcriptional regulator [Promicromonospora sukumoe]|uniref:DNA-binding IclR family transcriptional regulator n=1 Tax=Promicromonospora sukumoe TaxID=88382 RepID=A0A7W3J654_9MICO|nr:IclR family transcriptional regulator [Promicromonospora sukumoe]MBA8806963.1 DNA-binding IclR family transcriptional regulator [Promicromonospora sukumoe]
MPPATTPDPAPSGTTPPGTTPPESSSPLQTVDRALQVLLSYSETRTEWGVFELAEEFGITKSTSQRLLAALAAQGFLAADPYTRRYHLGPAMWRMAALWERGGGLARLAEQVLADLAAATGRTASFTIPDGFHVRCIAAVDGEHGPVRSHPLVGDLYPAHAGATSRAYFAFLDPLARRNMLSGRPFARYTELTEVDEAGLDRLFDEAYRTGWAFSEGEYDSTTRAIAAPVLIGSNPVGSISVVEPKVFEYDDDLRDHVPALLDAAATLAGLLHRPPTPAQRDWRRGRSRAARP